MSVIKGKLKLKGTFGQKMEKKEEKIKKLTEEEQLKQSEELFKKDPNAPEEQADEIITFTPVDAVGRIITSSNTVQGDGSKFSEQLKKDDFILIYHPQSMLQEERKVACVMSDKSLLLYKPFSSDVMSFIQFQTRKQDEVKEAEERIEDVYKKKMIGLTKRIVKDKDDTQLLEYREKKGMWGYNTVRKQVDSTQTRESLLDIKAKKSRDKFCWI